MTDITQIVGQLGFPIAVAVLAICMVWKQTQRTQDFLEKELRDRDDRMNSLLQEIQQSIGDVKTIIQLLADKCMKAREREDDLK